MRLRESILVVVLLLINAYWVVGQDGLGVTTQISLEQGLSDRTITDIRKDKHGYLWIATRNGLNRYDGLHIGNYDNHPSSQTRISSKDIQRILCKDDGNLIIQYHENRRGLDVLSATSTQAQKLFLNKENGVLGQVERLVLDDHSDEVYILVSRKSELILQRLNSEMRLDSVLTFQNYEHRPSSKYNFLKLSENELVLNDNKNGLMRYDSTGVFRSDMSFDSIGVPREKGLANILCKDKNGRIWLTFADSVPGIYEFNEAAGHFVPFALEEEPSRYSDLWEDGLGNVIVAKKSTDRVQGLFFVASTDEVRNWDELVRQERVIHHIYSDDFERLLFLGTSSGVKKINQTKKRVKNFLARDDLSNGGNNMKGLLELEDGSIVMSSDLGQWYRLDANRDSISPIDFDTPHDQEVQYCNCAKELIQDPEGLVWGARYSNLFNGELLSMNMEDGAFVAYPFPNMIQSLTLCQDGMIWMVSGDEKTENRLSSFDRSSKTFHHYFLPDGTNPLKNYRATYLFESEDQSKWIGTHSGVVRIELDGTMDVFQSLESDYYGLSGNKTYCINEDSQNRIWIGTDGGVNMYDPNNVAGEFVYFDTRDGLSGNNVCGILEDDNGNMWFSTFGGLSYYDTDLKSFRNFGIGDGFSHYEFNQFSFFKDRDGGIFFGCVNGMNYFNPNELLERNLDAPILLSELSYYDKVEGAIVDHLHNLQNIEKVVLPASNRYFHCSFALADYSYPQLNQYQYRLEGQDIGWTWIGTQNELSFNNLSSGDYVLRIRGTDRNLNISSREFALPIKVNQFFYRKSWFILLCIGLVLLSIYLFHKMSLRQAIEMERLRTKISSDLHDDVGGLLSGLAMQTELLEYSASEKDKPKLKRISDMSRNAMAQMRDVIWATDARKDRFEDLLVRMKEYAAEILFSRSITCHFHTKGILMDRKLPVQVRQNLYLIFKEAITNVAKHSDATEANISLVREGTHFEMTISDNGTKLRENGQTSSLNGSGLKNMQMRAKNINATFDINKENGFTITLRMKALV